MMAGLLIPVLIHIGVLFFTLDMATDCKLIHFYYTSDQMTYFWITLFFTAGPWIFNNIYLYWDKDLGCNKYVAGFMSICQVLVIYCIIRNLVLIWKGKTRELNSSNNTLRIIENFGESMPQLFVQSFIILKTLAKNNFVMDETFSFDVLWNAIEEGVDGIPHLQLASVLFSLCSVTMGFVIFAFEDATLLYQFVLFIFSLVCAGLRVGLVVFVATYEDAAYTWWIPPMLGFIASFLVWLVRRYCLCLPGICAVIEPEVQHIEMNHRPALLSESRIPIAMSNTSRNPEPVQQRSLGALNVLVWFTNLVFNWYNITGLLINLSLLGSYAFFVYVLEYNDDDWRRASIALIATLVMTVANIGMMVVSSFCSCLRRCSCCGTCGFKTCCFCKGCYVEETDWLY